MATGLVLLAVAPGIGGLYVAYSIVGLGMVGFFAVDIALATQVLPTTSRRTSAS